MSKEENYGYTSNTTPEVGDYIRFYVEVDGMIKSYAGTVIKEHPGWHYYLHVACIDGKTRTLSLNTRSDVNGNVIYEPKFVNYGKSCIRTYGPKGNEIKKAIGEK